MPPAGNPRASGRRFSLAVFPREQAIGEREERQKRDAKCSAFAKDCVFRLAMKEAVLVLHTYKFCGARFRGRVSFVKLIGIEVRTSDLPDFSAFHKLIECTEGVGYRH